MHSLVNIIGVVLIEQTNWSKWYKKIKHTLIFNDFWDNVCDGKIAPTKPIDAKELVVWNMKNYKVYALIAA